MIKSKQTPKTKMPNTHGSSMKVITPKLEVFKESGIIISTKQIFEHIKGPLSSLYYNTDKCRPEN